MSRGRKTDLVAYVIKEWNPPEPKAGAEWADKIFNAAEEVLREPVSKDAFKLAIDNGSAVAMLNGVEHWLSDVLAKLVWPAARLDELLPWGSTYTMHAHDPGLAA